MNTTELAVIEVLARLTDNQQQQLLAFARHLTDPEPVQGEVLLRLVETLNFEQSVVEEMAEAINLMCEQVESEPDEPLFT
jgi:hypothetical protein